MFSVHSTRGSVSIIFTDILVSYFFFILFFLVLPDSSEILISGDIDWFLTFTFFTLIIIFSLTLTNLYSFFELIYPPELLKRTILAFLISCGYIVTLGFFIRNLSLINWRLLPPLGSIYTALFCFRYIVFFGLPLNRKRVLILGSNQLSREIISEAINKRFRGYQIIGIVTSIKEQVGSFIQGVPVLGLIENIDEIASNHPVDIIVVALRDRRGKLPVRSLLKLKIANISIREGSSFYEDSKKNIIIDEFLKPSWFVFEEGFSQTPLHRAIKRSQGILVSITLLTLLSPLLILLMIMIKFESPGPVFYRQERIGIHGRIFNLLKFRSMKLGAEEKSGPTFAQENDPRITRVGRFIRRFRLDEVPQFINIFIGDMDLVGPRPERPVFVRQLEELIPYYNLRHSVRPGLTGWAQVHYPYGDSLDDSKSKLQYDLYYVKHSSWFLDLYIMLLTIKEVLFARGR